MGVSDVLVGFWRGAPGSGGGSAFTGVVLAPVSNLSGTGTAGSPLKVDDALIARVVALESGGGEGTPGASAYEVAVANGFVGTVTDWLSSLRGAPGTPGADGVDGDDGASAYQVAVANGFVGTETEWLSSLKGDDGAPGQSAYAAAVAGGFVGTLAEWLSSLNGADGSDGADGISPTFARITQAAYDALTPAERDNPAILYLITG